jgi:hypothetical protein
MKQLFKNKLLIITISIFVFIATILGGLYIKNQNDIKNYKRFCSEYNQLNNKILKNEELYSNYIKAIKNYVDVFTKYEGYAKVSDDNKANIEQYGNEYISLVKELKNLESPQEFKDDYIKLLDLYDKDSIRRENINRDLKNNNVKNISVDYLVDNKDLIKSRNDFQSKITIVTKQKGMDMNEIITKIEK